MILERYTTEEMGQVWTLQNRYQSMLQVEKAVAKAQGDMGLIPKSASQAILKKAHFKLKNITDIEKVTRHDVTAFVQDVAHHVGKPHGSYVHWGLTSSDVLDTGLAGQIKQAGQVLKSSFAGLDKALKKLSLKHAGQLCCGRTHGIRAEPTSFGLKLAGFLYELRRNQARVEQALKQAYTGKVSGAVGAYHVLPIALEKRVCKYLGLLAEPVSTQVIPRDRHAELVLSLSLTASSLERLAVEIRHLQRSEVGEVSEAFAKHQTGSSAMPHKKNPIYSENVTGLARLIRSYALPTLENIALWHERDISHSSVERVTLPSTFILCDFALKRMAEVIENLKVDKSRMLKNLAQGGGQVFSSVLLANLVKKGLSRSKAYQLIQQVSFALKPGEHLQTAILKNKTVQNYLTVKEIKSIFSFTEQQKALVARVHKLLQDKGKTTRAKQGQNRGKKK